MTRATLQFCPSTAAMRVFGITAGVRGIDGLPTIELEAA
jgi:hypothetical protein